jgi:hypothetical protein
MRTPLRWPVASRIFWVVDCRLKRVRQQRLARSLLALDEDGVADAVAEKRAEVHRRAQEGREEVRNPFGRGVSFNRMG